ncbi:MAG: cadherin-like domain-containing protein [Magnetococcales bacterium]|nr:cadherin-like domain-containing protein [Magnetococcales bacterium]
MFAIMLTLAGCGGGGGESASSPTTPSVTLSGTIIEGPVKQAAVTVTDGSGKNVGSGVSGNDAQYRIDVDANATPPFQLTVSGGTDLVTQEPLATTLTSLVTDIHQTTANITPITTVIQKAAVAAAGGDLAKVSKADVEKVVGPVLKNFGFGIDAEQADFHPISSPVTDRNIASVTVASEAMGEMIRRVAGNDPAEQEKLFAVVAEDMADGKMDGRKDGAVLQTSAPAGADTTTIMAQVSLKSAMVAVEVVADTLRVTRRDGTLLSAEAVKSAMSESMAVVTPSLDPVAATNRLNAKTVSRNLKEQGVAALESAALLAPDASAILATRTSFENLTVGDVASGRMDATVIQEAAGALTRVVDSVKRGEIARETLTAAANNPPKAEPAGLQTTSGSQVSGTLAASDANSDPLTFLLHQPPGNGVAVILANGAFTYTPAAGFSGQDAFWFKVSDGKVASNAAKVTLLVSAVTGETPKPVVAEVSTPAPPAPPAPVVVEVVPEITIQDVVATEGDAGTANIGFTVTLSVASQRTVTVSWVTSDLTAINGSDYTFAAGVVTFEPGQTGKTVAVPIQGDTLDEGDETFKVVLSDPVNAVLAAPVGVARIVDDDVGKTGLWDRASWDANTWM